MMASAARQKGPDASKGVIISARAFVLRALVVLGLKCSFCATSHDAGYVAEADTVDACNRKPSDWL